MRQIKQKDEWGCGIACVAMVAGVSYEASKAVLHGRNEAVGTQSRHLIAALQHFDIAVGHRLIPLRSRRYSDLKIPAILKAGLKKEGHWHWLVWDPGQQLVRDPHDGPSEWKSANRRPRCISYLPVIDLDSEHF